MWIELHSPLGASRCDLAAERLGPVAAQHDVRAVDADADSAPLEPLEEVSTSPTRLGAACSQWSTGSMATLDAALAGVLAQLGDDAVRACVAGLEPVLQRVAPDRLADPSVTG